MSELTFKNVMNDDFELEHTISQSVGENYERLTSFRRGRDFNAEVKSYMKSFVADFSEFLNADNEAAMNERLVKYNKLVAELKTTILSATKVPSIMISGGSNYPAHKKRKEEERIHSLESELYSDNGKHARFIENTRKMFDPVLKKQAEDVEKMRKQRSEEKGWETFFKEVEHEEIEGYGIDVDDNRIYIQTYNKPSPELRAVLKACALRWSPKNVRWQRILTQNAINSLQHNLKTSVGIEIEVN
ncbi:hypothetical protein [Vagococcus fluvialis]|uniref:hypothetical protein n=1 Tax=Vagococcus fluvialis TaxID=2738 RepID=UPI001D0A9F29|nr:hypothetical protein [Vagococcus fluvialis]UDM70158.1 hypothetical protein K5L00_08390 [Vagococcus fluvialis]UDM77577.1 hypothetical protein K5K98_03935 [Vagococcus fluvialis]UDM81847.1 hypothetical protein K5K96_10870 [Vagococcus fluvialis]